MQPLTPKSLFKKAKPSVKASSWSKPYCEFRACVVQPNWSLNAPQAPPTLPFFLALFLCSLHLYMLPRLSMRKPFISDSWYYPSSTSQLVRCTKSLQSRKTLPSKSYNIIKAPRHTPINRSSRSVTQTEPPLHVLVPITHSTVTRLCKLLYLVLEYAPTNVAHWSRPRRC